jgi:hypothetical protein
LLNVNTILWASLPFGSVYIQACRDVSASLLIKGTVSWYFSGSFSESWTGKSSTYCRVRTAQKFIFFGASSDFFFTLFSFGEVIRKTSPLEQVYKISCRLCK